MTGLITTKRIDAMSFINRYNGWTDRPFSILEHTVIGTTMLRHENAHEDDQRGFLFHDVEESAFTDMIRPHKEKYMNDQYDIDVAEWNADLCAGHGMKLSQITSPLVTEMDDRMLAAEIKCIARITDPKHPYDEHLHGDIRTMIQLKTFGTPDLAVAGFWVHYHRLFP